MLADQQADLDVDIYMELLQGFNVEPASGRYVLNILKNLYDLKQARHNWFEKLSSALGSLSINSSKVDPYVVIWDNIIVLLFFDDCLIFLQEKDKINPLIDKLFG